MRKRFAIDIVECELRKLPRASVDLTVVIALSRDALDKAGLSLEEPCI